MYILLSGQYPFRAKTKDELLHKIRKEPVSFKDRCWKRTSKEAKTLLAELLRKRVETRCEVIEALEHTWFQQDCLLPDVNIMEDVLASMTHFQTLNMMQKAAITALAWRASDEDTQHLRKIFESIDRDGNGYVTVDELRHVFEQTGVAVTADISMLAKSSGTDGNDTIEYTEFIAAAMDKKNILKEEVVWEAFKIFDLDGSGTVTKKELLQILTGRTSDKIRQVHGDKAIDNFLLEYDTTGDAVIDFDEFMGMLSTAGESYKVQCANSHAVDGGAASRSSTSARRSMSARNPSKVTGVGGANANGGNLAAWVPPWCSSCTGSKSALPEQIVGASGAVSRQSLQSKNRRSMRSNR
jgi:calcium-dependent protein kinase